MYRFLGTPRWIAATVVVAAVAVVFVALGGWQLDRLEQRRLENDVRAVRLAADPLPLDGMLAGAGDDPASIESLEYRRVTATGTYLPAEEVLVRNRTNADGVAGFWVLTPLVLEAGGTVVVNRGWIPLRLDTPPITDLPPPDGVVTVDGFVRLDEDRPRFGPVDPPGRLAVFSRVDLDRLVGQVTGPMAPVWIQRSATDRGALPTPLDLPDVDDEGPHLGYAIQWFAFAAIAVVGYGLLVRRSARSTRSSS